MILTIEKSREKKSLKKHHFSFQVVLPNDTIKPETREFMEYKLQDLAIKWLEECLSLEMIEDSQKIPVMDYIISLKLENELFELELNPLLKKNLPSIVKRFGRKAQSSE